MEELETHEHRNIKKNSSKIKQGPNSTDAYTEDHDSMTHCIEMYVTLSLRLCWFGCFYEGFKHRSVQGDGL